MVRTSFKSQIRELLEMGDLGQVAEVALSRRRTLGQLVSLTFDSDPLIVYRAIEATGLCAERLAPTDPEALLELLRRLNWMITEESGGICWRAPEMMAEVVRRDPVQFGDFLDVVASFLITMEPEDLEHFRISALRALGLLGIISDERQTELIPLVITNLDSPDPQVRAMSVLALSEMGEHAVLEDRSGLLSDDGEVEWYADGDLSLVTVADMTRSVLDSRRHTT
ncbi:DVU0298 family protein [Candidatus Zixiibacteriota bacterium]